MSFPFRKYTKNDLIKEYNSLKEKLMLEKINSQLKYSRIGSKCSNKFFQYERIKTPSQGKISCYEYWLKNKKKLLSMQINQIKNQMIYLHLYHFLIILQRNFYLI